MRNTREWEIRTRLIFITLAGMLAGLFLSRALLSLSLIGFAGLTLLHRDFPAQLRSFFREPLLAGLSLLFFIPLLTGLWSSDTPEWTDTLRIKLPLLLLPLGFAAPWQGPRRYWEGLALLLLTLTLGGAAWSAWHYFTDPREMAEAYLRAKTLPTPLQGDRIRFSWIVVLALLSSAWLLYTNRNRRSLVIPLSVVIAVLTAYLHLLAVRTGLGAFYLALILVSVFWLFRKRSLRSLALALLLLTALPLGAYFLFPTLQNRLRYIQYDKGYFEKGHYWQGGNDALRVISWKAGLALWKETPVLGTGFGDLRGELSHWYEQQYPLMRPEEKLLPASEWILHAAAGGFIGLLGFAAAMLLPLFTRVRYRTAWWILNGAAGFTLLFDIGLEVQYGVFLHAFALLAGWKWLNAENNTSL